MAVTHRYRATIAASIVLVSLLLFGCDFFDGWFSNSSGGDREVERLKEETKSMLEEVAKENEEYNAEADQVLAAGEVLSVRVNYGESGAAQCQVRIDNERNGWYDEVEFIAHAGSLASVEKPYGDYGFGADNFNRQITNPNNAPLYTPEAVEGAYRITVAADTGYSANATVSWDGERFSPSLLSFSLD